jgi:hypothetical protein
MHDNFIDKFMEWTAIIHAMGWLSIVLISFFVTIGGWLFSALAIMLGAKIAKIDDRSFGKAFLAVILIFILGGIITSILSFISPFLGLLGLIVPVLFIQWVYSSSFGEALVTYIMSLIFTIVLYFGLAIAIAFGLIAFGKHIESIKEPEGKNINQEQKIDNTSDKEDTSNSDSAAAKPK